MGEARRRQEWEAEVARSPLNPLIIPVSLVNTRRCHHIDSMHHYTRTSKGKGGLCTKRKKLFLFFHHRSIKTWQSAVMEKMHNMIKFGNQHV